MGSVLSTGTVRGYEGPISEVEDNAQQRFQALHHMFVASALVVKYAHDNYPDYVMGNMSIFAASYPSTCDPADVVENQQQMNITNWFCSDVQVRGEYPSYMDRFFKENDIHIKMEPGDDKILSEGGVDMYTFSYYMSNCITTHKDTEENSGNLLTGFKNPYLKSSD